MLPGFLLESSKSLHVWIKNFIILPSLFVLSLSCALWQLHVSDPRGTCVYSSFTSFVCLLILQLKYSFSKGNTTCRQATNILPWICTSVHWQMRAGPCWTASSAIHVQWLWRVLTLRVLNISSGFHINIEFRLQELPEGNKHSQFMFSGHFKSFW